MERFSYYKMRFPFDHPQPNSDLSLGAALRCHIISARERLITWGDCWNLVRFDVGEAVRGAPRALGRWLRARYIRRRWARAFAAASKA